MLSMSGQPVTKNYIVYDFIKSNLIVGVIFQRKSSLVLNIAIGAAQAGDQGRGGVGSRVST